MEKAKDRLEYLFYQMIDSESDALSQSTNFLKQRFKLNNKIKLHSFNSTFEQHLNNQIGICYTDTFNSDWLDFQYLGFILDEPLFFKEDILQIEIPHLNICFDYIIGNKNIDLRHFLENTWQPCFFSLKKRGNSYFDLKNILDKNLEKRIYLIKDYLNQQILKAIKYHTILNLKYSEEMKNFLENENNFINKYYGYDFKCLTQTIKHEQMKHTSLFFNDILSLKKYIIILKENPFVIFEEQQKIEKILIQQKACHF